MTKITENDIELLEHLGYQYIYAPDIANDGKYNYLKNGKL